MTAVSAAGLAAAASLAFAGCSSAVDLTACSAIGYLYRGPAVVEFAEPLAAAATVAACFGDDCTPFPVEGSGETRAVPQESPYLGAGSIGDGSERALRVVVTDGDRTIVDGVFEIPVAVEPTGVFGQCPGPFRFEPVEVPMRSASATMMPNGPRR